MPSWPLQPWARSSSLSPHKPSFGHAPVGGRHQWHVLPETYSLFRAVFFGLVPALLNKSLCRRIYSKALWTSFYQPECTFALVFAGTSQPGHLYISRRAPSCIWSRAPEEFISRVLEKWEAEKQQLTLVQTSLGVELQRCFGTCSQVSWGTWLHWVSVTCVESIMLIMLRI